MVQANEVSREALLLRDVGILFQEVQALRNENTALKRQNDANLTEIARLSDLVTLLQNGRNKAETELKINKYNERMIYIKKIKSIRKMYKFTQRELSKHSFFDVTSIENKRSSIEMTKEACLKIEFLHESGELKRLQDEKELLTYEN